MQITHEHDGRTDDSNELFACPYTSCGFAHESINGLMGHVGSHPDAWDGVERSPREFHQQATVADERQAKRAAKVQAWLAREGVLAPAVRVYVHQRFGSVQIAHDDPDDEYLDLVQDTDGVRFDPKRGVNYCSDEFVQDLPVVRESALCDAEGCGRSDTLAPVVRGENRVLTLCRYHRKQFLEVTT